MSGGGGGGNSKAIEAGGAFVRLFVKDGLAAGLEGGRRKLAAFGAYAAKAGAVALSVGGAALGAIGSAAVGTLGDTAKLAAAADAFGLTAEEASRLFGVMGSAGSDIRDATEGLVTLGQRVTDAIGGKGEEAAEFFQKLGVGADQFAGKNPAEQFDLLLASLRGVQDPATRVQLLLKAVGEDTGKNLIPLLGQSAEEIAALGRQFELSAGEMGAAKEATAAYNRATALLSQAWTQIAVAVAPTIKMLADGVSAAVVPVTAFLRQNRQLVVVAVAVAAGIAAAGAALVGIGAVAGLAATAMGGVAAIVGAVLSPIGLVTAAVVGLGLALFTQTDLLDGFVAAIQQTVGGVVDALSAGNMELAGKVAMAGLTLAWEEGILTLQRLWTGFKGFFVDGFHGAVLAVRVAFEDLTSGIATMLVGLVDQLANGLGDDLASLLGLDGVRTDLAGVVKEIERENERVRNKLMNQAGADQLARDAAREADLAGSRAAVSAARAELDRLTEEAAKLANAPKKKGEDKSQNRTDALMAAVGKTAGAFLGGSGAVQTFGSSTLAGQQLAAQKDAAGQLKTLNGKVDGLPQGIGKAVADALTFG